MRKFLRFSAAILLIGSLGGLGYYWMTRPVPVKAAKAHRGLLLEEVFGTGTLEAKVAIGVSAKIIGKVTDVLVDQGDTVKAGQVLARLEATDYENAVRLTEARVSEADAELAKAKLDIERNRPLLQNQTISQAEFDATKTGYDLAEAKRRSAEADLGVARAHLADTKITSPVSGLVVTRNLEVGSTVVPGAPIFRLAETEVIWVQAMVDEAEIGKLKVGQPAQVVFRFSPREPRGGRVTRLAREADRVTEELQVDVTVEDLPPNYFLGQKADVFVETSRKADALQVPMIAIIRRDRTPGVFVLSQGRARWREVKLGLVGRENVEVLSGVAEEDVVIVQPFIGKVAISEGQRISPAEKAEAP